MAITYNKVKQEVANLLSAVLGSTSASAEANYTTTIADGTLIGPDFQKTAIEDAIVAAQGEIVEAIALTPLHPERARFADATPALANRATLPRTGSGSGKLIIGVPGVVRDSATGKACLPVDLDRVRSFTEFSTTVYNGFSPHWYAINSGRIEHTRANVVIEVCVYERPTVFGGAIDIDDHNEGALVMGAVAKLALKESMFESLFAGANAAWQAHLAQIRGYGQPALYGLAQSAPSST